MIWAIKDHEKIKATPKEIAKCPICKTDVISKCGVVKEWHWSHKSLTDCDDWSEPESAWHLKWKSYFPKEQQEVTIENHRADIQTKDYLIIELQNSSIAADDICDREMFYEKMIWLLNGETLGKNIELRDKGSYFTFVWKHPPKSWWNNSKPIYIDLGKYGEDLFYIFNDKWIKSFKERFWDKIFLIKKLYDNIPCGGWGILLTKEEFLKQYGTDIL